MYHFKNIHQLQIEPTTYCNSFCPGCARNIFGGKLNSLLKLNHIQLKDWHKVINHHNLKYIKSIYFNGQFGDCCMHPNFIEMIEHLLSVKSTLDVKIMTNGGMQTNEFWGQLSKTLQKFSYHSISFALDGLEDTLSIYRRNIDYNTVINHAKTFIDAGGIAEWRMILFDHNKHQVQSAKELSNKLKFANFYIINSYATKLNAVKYKKFPKQSISAPDKKITKQYQSQYNETFIPFNSCKYDDNLNVVCPWLQERWLQIDSNGHVWPCCYTAEEQLLKNEWNLYYLQKTFGVNFNNMIENSLDKILENDFYQQYVPSMWRSSTTCLECNSSN